MSPDAATGVPRAPGDAPPALAPVALFAYRRVEHLREAVASLQRNPEAPRTDLVVFCDAAARPEHADAVAAVRAHVAAIDGFRSVTRVLRSENLGLARSILGGVSQLLAGGERVIVVEDDLVVSPHFLRYMNEALERYAAEPRVACVHGYSYPAATPLPETFFLRGGDCWGWATWSRAWARFEQDGTRLHRQLRDANLLDAFDLDGAYPYAWMLEQQIAGKIDSWAIRWHASCFVQDLLTLYPGRSLVRNIGTDASGTHCESTEAFEAGVAATPIRLDPIAVEPSAAARAAIARFLRTQRPMRTRVRHLVHTLLGI